MEVEDEVDLRTCSEAAPAQTGDENGISMWEAQSWKREPGEGGGGGHCAEHHFMWPAVWLAYTDGQTDGLVQHPSSQVCS